MGLYGQYPRIVLQRLGTPTIYTTVTDAVAAIQNGDTIYIPGGTFDIGNLTISKKVQLIGVGHYADSTLATGVTKLQGNIYFTDYADNGSMTGIWLSGSVFFGTTNTNQDVNNYTITRCKMDYLYLSYNGSDNTTSKYFTVSNNLISMIFGGNAQNCTINNNIIDGGIYYFNRGGTFKNNTILGQFDYCNYAGCNTLWYLTSCTFENNIFIDYSPIFDYISSCVFKNNLWVANISFPSGTNTGSGNIVNQAYSDIFIDVPTEGFLYTHNFHLKTTCAGLNAGTDGKDVGIYGGIVPYSDGAVPLYPHIRTVNIDEKLDTNGKLPVNINVTNAANIVAYQYWLDESFSSRKTQSITPSSIYKLTTSIDYSTLTKGVHTFNIRFKDSNGKWSAGVNQLFQNTIYVPDGVTNSGIVSIEYWLDEEGFSGRHIIQTVPAYGGIDATRAYESIDIPAGIHILNIRGKDNLGRFSGVVTGLFHSFQAPPAEPVTDNKIVAWEYWLDNDLANKVTTKITAINLMQIDKILNLNLLKVGLHTLNIRAVDNKGNYSSLLSQNILILNNTANVATQITGYESWFDDDFQHKTFTPLSAGSSFSLIKDVDVSSLSNGLHIFNIRFKDNAEKWSSVTSNFFQKIPATSINTNMQITGYEYWVDDNYGAKVTQNINPTSNLALLQDIDLSNINDGLHIFNIRFKDNAGQWSSIINSFFQKIPFASVNTNKQIIGYEYWIDDNYNAKVIQNVSPTTNLSLVQDIDLSNLKVGLHIFNIRFRETTGQLSSVTSSFFQKTSPSNSIVNNTINSYRYWFDDNSAAIEYKQLSTPVNPLNLISDIEIPYLAVGNHVFNVQFKDLAGQWSGLLSETFYVSDCMPNKPLVPNGITQLCLNSSNITYSTQSVKNATSYAWTLSPSSAGIVSGSTNTATIDWNNTYSGNVQVTVKSVNPCGTSVASDPITVTIHGLATITNNAAADITPTSATISGTVNADAFSPITSRGLCWSTNSNPTIANNSLALGNGNGTVSSSISGLLPNTTYYARIWTVNCSGLNYGTNISLTTTKHAQTITSFETIGNKTYGDALVTLVATASSNVAVTFTSSNTQIVQITGNTMKIVGAGAVTITAKQSGNNDYYAAADVSQTITVSKATLTAKADDKTKIYGQSLPTFTQQITGYVNGDIQTVIDVLPMITTTATTNSAVGKYDLTISGGSDNNYDFVYTKGNLDVTKATITVTAEDKTKVYGSTNPTFTAKYTGFVLNETPSVLTGSPELTTVATESSKIGAYTINLSLGTLQSANYDFMFVNAILTVNKAQLSVIAENKTREYGQTNPSFTYKIMNFVLTDNESVVSGTPTITCSATQTSDVQTYPIAIAIGSLSAENYSFQFTNGTLTVDKALLTVKAVDKSKVYGQANPILTVEYQNFKNTDNSSVLTGAASLTTTAVQSSVVGDYPITANVGTLTAKNYKFEFLAGNLKITKALLTVTAQNESKIYGSGNPQFTPLYSGFVLNETGSVLTGSPELTTTAIASSKVGAYTIASKLGTLQSANYDFKFAEGTLTVNKAQLTVIAENKTRAYGSVNPDLTHTITGFVLNEDKTVLNGMPSLTCAVTSISDVNSYPIAAAKGTLVEENYSYQFVNGNLTVTKAQLTAKADDKQRNCNEANPTFTITYTGWKNTDSETVLNTKPTIACVATLASNAGTYPITLTGGSDNNYEILSTNGVLTVNAILSTVTTGEITNIANFGATVSGSVTSTGGSDIIKTGICWATTSKPTIVDNSAVGSSVSGIFTATLSLLKPNLQYFVRAFAINALGVSYGNEINFNITGISTLSDFDATIFPNPNNGHFTIRLDNDYKGEVTIKIHSIIGSESKIVKFNKTNNLINYSVEMDDLAKGTYFVELQTVKYKVVKIIIVN